LRLAPENIESVVHIALALAGQPPLLPAAVAGIPRAFQVPDFRDPSWAPCLEGIYHPHDYTKRPIVFDAMAVKDRDDVVLAHLNHRLVQMCLRLLRAEIWAPEGVRKLHRVTARIVPDHVLDTPAVIAHARLVLVGNDSQRLHEEIISASGLVREGRLSRMNVMQVQAANAAQLDDEPDGYTKLQLQSIWSNVAAGLTQALEARSRDRAAAIQKKLAERAGQEADKITAILNELTQAIRAELAQDESPQLELFTMPERDQFERNRDSLRARLNAIPAEIEREVRQIRERYAEPDPRLFPVAVTFLVPRRHAGGR
jgi:hypothetical protein